MALLPHPARAYIRHLLTAGNRHDVHSPFVYALVTEALRPRTPRSAHADIEALRRKLLQDPGTITVTDLGAGPKQGNTPRRRVRSIARTALKPRRQAEQLARITGHFRPRTILELGTSLGLSTLYLARAAPHAQVHTVEGCPATAAIARANFSRARADNIVSHIGSFAEQLPRMLDGIKKLDLAFIDGHHLAGPTLTYFGQCLPKAHNDSVFIFDDIHWSADMELAWQQIKEHPRVTVTVDLFHFGLAFLRQEQQREHFRLRY